MYIYLYICIQLPNGSGAPSLSQDAPSATPKSDELHPAVVQTRGTAFATSLCGISSLSPPVPLLANPAVDAGKPAQVLASLERKKALKTWLSRVSGTLVQWQLDGEPKLKGFSYVLCPTHRRVKYKRLCAGSQVLVTGADLRLGMVRAHYLGLLRSLCQLYATLTRISLRIHQHG